MTSATRHYLPTVGVEDNAQRYLQDEMGEGLLTVNEEVLARRTDLTIRYQFVRHNEGSRIGRSLASGSKAYIMSRS